MSTEDNINSNSSDVEVLSHLLDTSDLKWKISHFYQQSVIWNHIVEGIKINFFS